MTTGSPDLRPFRERVLELIEIVSPGSGLKPASEVLNRLRGRIGSWVDERLRLYERASAEVEELRADRVKLQGEIERLTHELAEAHATQEPPVEDGPLKPKRGDRVRLEGARAGDGRRLDDGWYDVIGHDGQGRFQITTRESTDRDDLSAWMPWLLVENPGLKEVRRGAAKLPE